MRNPTDIVTMAVLCIVLSLAACADRKSYRHIQPIIQLKKETVPAKGIYTVKDVVILPRGGNDYEFAAAANEYYGVSEVQAVVYCRAQKFAYKQKFDDWYPQVSVNVLASADGTRTVNAIITFFREEFPKSAAQDEAKTDWCSKLPQ